MLEAIDIRVTIQGTSAVAGTTLRAPSGKVTALIGPSGCGKTTLLRVIAGLQQPDAGTVLWNGAPLDGLPPHVRPIGLMFQDFALFPHRTVAANVGFGLRMQGLATERVAQRVDELLDLVGLPGFDDRDIAGLSGGEQQRVALARALAPEPQVLMLDEPLGSLDGVLKNRLLGEMQTIFATLGLTVVYVTHDTEEAFTVANHLAAHERGPHRPCRRPGRSLERAGNRIRRSIPRVCRRIRSNGRAEASPTWDGRSIPVAGSGHIVVLRPGAVSISDDGPIAGVIETATYRGGWYDLTMRRPTGGAGPREIEGGATPWHSRQIGGRSRRGCGRRLTSADQVAGVDHRGEFFVEVGCRHPGEVTSPHHDSVHCGAIKRVGGIEHEQHVVPEIAALACRCLAAEVGLDTAHGDAADAL